MVKRECPDCGKGFEYTPNPNFADKRKYCDECGMIRKETWNAKNGKTEAKKPVAMEVIKTADGAIVGPKGFQMAPKDEFKAHLSIEQVRMNAMEIALKLEPNMNLESLKKVAEDIELWMTR